MHEPCRVRTAAPAGPAAGIQRTGLGRPVAGLPADGALPTAFHPSQRNATLQTPTTTNADRISTATPARIISRIGTRPLP